MWLLIARLSFRGDFRGKSRLRENDSSILDILSWVVIYRGKCICDRGKWKALLLAKCQKLCVCIVSVWKVLNFRWSVLLLALDMCLPLASAANAPDCRPLLLTHHVAFHNIILFTVGNFQFWQNSSGKRQAPGAGLRRQHPSVSSALLRSRTKLKVFWILNQARAMQRSTTTSSNRFVACSGNHRVWKLHVFFKL